MLLLKRGMQGEEVKTLQRLLKIVVDGDFGSATERAVKAFQRENGLKEDGVVGDTTMKLLEEHTGASRAISDLVPKEVLDLLPDLFKVFELNTLNRRAMFLAQCAHESNHFKTFEENLNYSREALLRVFPKYFNESNVDEYARQPEKIANRVYANRMGNGDEASGDGYRNRGLGAIQLTGKINQMLYGGSNELPEALYSAGRYWLYNNLNQYADSDDIVKCSKFINVGNANSSVEPIGLEDRVSKYNLFKGVLK